MRAKRSSLQIISTVIASGISSLRNGHCLMHIVIGTLKGFTTELDNKDLNKIIDSLTRDNEEKIYQMSQVRLVAETMAQSLLEPDYFDQVCSDFIYIFNSLTCAIFWYRHREPAGWYLDSWASRSNNLYPSREFIPHNDEGFLEWVKQHDKPLYLESIRNEPVTQIWGPDSPEKCSITLFPFNFDEMRFGMLVLIDPSFNISAKNIQRHVDVLGNLISASGRNWMLYKKLMDSEEQFRDLFENSSDMVMVVYPDGIIHECNNEFINTLKLKEDPHGKRLMDLIKEDKDVIFRECWSKLLNGHDVKNVDIFLKCADGSSIEAEFSANVKFLRNGRIGMIRLYMRDVTDKRRAERRQRELEHRVEFMRQRELAQIGLYVSGIAHNLQNPIQVLLGHLELMRMQGKFGDKLEPLEQASRNIQDIIDTLLTKIHLERNVEIVEIDINKLLERELNFLDGNLFFKHEVKKIREFSENLPPVHGKYGDFSQSIMNVVYNALDAMRESSRKELKICTKFLENDDLIRIEISDTGPGISAEIRDKLFQPFFTTKNMKKKKTADLTGGSGLGLSSSKSLLEPYKAVISFDVNTVKGTTFYIDIPVEKRAGSDA